MVMRNKMCDFRYLLLIFVDTNAFSFILFCFWFPILLYCFYFRIYRFRFQENNWDVFGPFSSQVRSTATPWTRRSTSRMWTWSSSLEWYLPIRVGRLASATASETAANHFVWVLGSLGCRFPASVKSSIKASQSGAVSASSTSLPLISACGGRTRGGTAESSGRSMACRNRPCRTASPISSATGARWLRSTGSSPPVDTTLGRPAAGGCSTASVA